MIRSPLLSVSIITKDEAHRIERCLDAVAFADEIVVLDSGSADGTAQLARARGAKVVVDPAWPGFGPQKNRALALCEGDWVLSIDADEVVTPELRAAIERVIRAEGPEHGWWLRRESSWCGRTIRHGDWRGDRVLRLFRRGQARFSDDAVHERVLCPGPHGLLDGMLQHDSVDSLADAQAKMRRYAHAGAARLRARGRGGVASALGHAAWTFARGWIVRGGFLDGRAGWQIAATNARGTYLRYLWAGLPESDAPAPERQTHGDRPPP